MRTECSGGQNAFPWVDRRRLEARFDGGHLSSDGGGLLLRAVEAQRAGASLPPVSRTIAIPRESSTR